MDFSAWNLGGSPGQSSPSPYPDMNASDIGASTHYSDPYNQPVAFPVNQGYPQPQPDPYNYQPQPDPNNYQSQSGSGYWGQSGYSQPSYPSAPPTHPASMYNPSTVPIGDAFGMGMAGAVFPSSHSPAYPTPQPGGYPSGSNSYSDPRASGMIGNKCEDIYNPTVKPYPKFDVNLDCECLKKAMAGAGCNNKPILEIMPNRSVDQRVAIVKQFKTMYGKDLIKTFLSELHGHFEQTIEGLCYSQVVFLARELRRAMAGAGTNERALIEILVPQSNEMIARIKTAYQELYPGRNLERDITSETSGHFNRVLISLCQGNRDENQHVDQQAARRDAEELYRAGEKRIGTDKSTFNMILVSRSYAHLRAVFDEYKRVSKRDIEGAIKSEVRGDLLESYLAIVRFIQDKIKYYAYELKKSMQGAGTRDSDLIRIIISRCEIDLGEIKKEFQKLTGKTLEDWITKS